MAAIPVVVKHSGKKYEVELDPSSSGEDFKLQLYSLTNVEPERQKILVKGGQLKDDKRLGDLGVKAGHVFMMMGTPSTGAGVIEKPTEKTRFLEDMTEAEAAQAEGAIPAGLQNLGNTCYMNSTLQALKAIPELQEELTRYSSSSTSSGPSPFSFAGSAGLGGAVDLTANLRDLFKQMSETQDGFPPLAFLNALRQAFPQFAQKARDGHGWAQQDAEEAWSQIISQLRSKLKVKDESAAEATKKEVSFVDRYMAGRFNTTLECDEEAAKEAGEEAVHGHDTFFKLNCHITGEVNHLSDGLKAGLSEKIEKRSEVLGRDAIYTKTSSIARLPKYLTVHFMRFDWRKTTNKKAKIMRKVTFPAELDVVEYCSDDLKRLLIPVRDKIRDVRKEVEVDERARKRQKRMKNGEEPASEEKAGKDKKEASKKSGDAVGKKPDGDTDMADVEFKTDEQLEAERAASILAAKKELIGLVDQKLKDDIGGSQTGLYELRGVVTHQGASADSGHYTAFVKKSGRKDPNTGKLGEEDGKWWWFNDDKVSEVDADRIETLSGGGQSHSALILLYRSVPLPSIDEDTPMS